MSGADPRVHSIRLGSLAQTIIWLVSQFRKLEQKFKLLARMHEYVDETTTKIEEEQGYPVIDPQRQMIADDAIYFVIGPDKHGRVKYMGRHISKSRYFRAQHPTIIPLTRHVQAERTPSQSTPVRNTSVQSTPTQSIQRQSTPMESSPIPSTTASVPQDI